ncbi:MAG: hypothetical protein Q8O67_25125 [Deltaproteobacteria bacterium]|nr:hypothetical protein [Deltaproteobacteria bacterium]
MQRLIAAHTALALLALSSCVTNPARHLKENDKDIVVGEDGSLKRGDEVLDEQDFYDLVDDESSAAAIAKTRAGGETFQMIGIPVAAVGAAAALGGVGLMYTSQDSTNAGPETGYAIYGLLFGGILAATGGGYLIVDGRNKTLGAERSFDVVHARASLEKGLYGTSGATPEAVKALVLKAADDRTTFCSVGGVGLKPLVAKDEKGRGIRIVDRADWFEYTSSPAGLVGDNGQFVRSPWTKVLKGLGDDVTVSVKVKATGVTTSLTLSPDFSCKDPGFNFFAGGGSSGNSGSWGSSGSGNGGDGGDGGDGGQGAAGGPGEEIDVDATTIAFRGKTLVVVGLKRRGAGDAEITVHDAALGPLFIGARGGPGGAGGSGGSGGSGSGGGVECTAGGDGGRGGRGGTGGPGGRGGEARVRVDGDAKALVSVDVRGGSGGSAGNGGGGGGSGYGTNCGDSKMDDGRRGPDGPDGQQGGDGGNGRVDVSKQGKKGLSLLQKALGSVPAN